MYTRRKDKAVQIIICAVLYVLLVLFVGSLFLLSCNYNKVYKSPTVSDGKVDFEGVDITSRSVACSLAGEWEFFYNQWIITDGAHGQADGMIKLPSVWTGRDFGNGRLPRTGYASYRLTVENVMPDVDITVFRHNSDIAYRVYLNGELNVRSGNVSKDVKKTSVSGRYDEKIPFRTDGSTIEIVIELSASRSGGLNAAPWLNYDWTGDTYGARLRSFTYVVLGIAVAAVVVSILSFIFFAYRRDITAPAFMVALFVHFMASKDLLYIFSFQFTLSRVLAFISAAAAVVFFVLHLKKCGAKFTNKGLIATGVPLISFSVLLFALYGTTYAPYAAALLMLTTCLHLIPIAGNTSLHPLQRIIYSTFYMVMISVFCTELCDGLGLLVYGTEFYFSIELMLMFACFTFLWLWKMAKAAHTAMRVSELEYELSAAKHHALQAQIKPHFVYNSLTAIQSRYRSGLKEGDKAIEQFARHLRLITDSDSEELIPFDNEIRNAMNYFELENLRADGKISLLLNTEFTDLSVPVLSLQPLVENAVRHGGLRHIKDGRIEITSQKLGNRAQIIISDNGKGFDAAQTPEGVGLENTRKRFEEMLGAELKVLSAPDHGTQIIIDIPME